MYRLEVASFLLVCQKLGIEKYFLFFWESKIVRDGINFPRRMWHRLRYSKLISMNPDSVEIERIAKDLLCDGIAISHIDKFTQMPKMDELKLEYEELLVKERGNPHSRKSKIFIERLIDDDYNFRTNRGKAIHTFVTNQSIALIAERYLGLVPKLTSFKVWRSHFTGDATRSASQNWHRDYNEFQMLRIFLYFNEVTEKNGAGEYVKSTHYLGDSYNILEYSEENGTYATDQEISDNFPIERIVIARGIPGTIVFIDTAGLHRGGFHPEQGERRVSLLTFSTAADLLPTKVRI